MERTFKCLGNLFKKILKNVALLLEQKLENWYVVMLGSLQRPEHFHHTIFKNLTITLLVSFSLVT